MEIHGLVLFLCAQGAMAARILVVPAHNMASHTKSMYPVVDTLANAGHEVVVLQIVIDAKEACKTKAEGVTDLVLKPNTSLQSKAMPKDIFWRPSSSASVIGGIFAWKMATEVCLAAFEDEKTHGEFDRILNEHWDLLMIDSIFAPCGIAAVDKLYQKRDQRRPLIAEMSTSLLLPASFRSVSVPVFSSAYPGLKLTKFENAEFMQRFYMLQDNWEIVLSLEIVTTFLIQNVWTRGHPHRALLSQATPRAFMHQIDFTIASLSPLIDFPRATGPAIMETDSNCPIETNPLPEPYASFVDDPKSKGTILFAMGHFTDWTYAPSGAIAAYIDAFARLSDYRVIWQFAQDASKLNVTSNVLVEKWIPQIGILYHPKTKVFISHMGLKSMREAICAKVPVASMPMFAEQSRNTALAQFRGFGVYLNKVTLTTDYVHSRLTEILHDKRYSESVSKFQDQLADRLRNPLDLLAFKIRYLIERNTERFLDKFLKIRGSTFPFVKEWNLDMVFTSATAVLMLWGFIA